MTIINEEELKEDMQDEQAEDLAADNDSEKKSESANAAETESSEDEKPENESSEEECNKSEVSEEDEELNIKYLRLMADFQNFRRRSERERSEIYARANESIVTSLLDVADNFERALAAGSAEEDENFRKGMEMIHTQFMDVLQKAGVSEIEAEGQDFDPNFHNAVMMEDTDKVESGKVSEVLQKGYTLNGRVIRPSMVKVAN